jgi:ABC-type uncharacterized transport system permease subunit
MSIVGSILIVILSLIIPSNPFKNIPAMSWVGVDKPLWITISIVGLVIYNGILFNLYDKKVNQNEKS